MESTPSNIQPFTAAANSDPARESSDLHAGPCGPATFALQEIVMESTPSNIQPFTAAENPVPIALPESCPVSGTLRYVPGQSGICESLGTTSEHVARSQAVMMMKIISARANDIDLTRPVYEAIRDGDISIEILAACYMMFLSNRMSQFAGRE